MKNSRTDGRVFRSKHRSGRRDLNTKPSLNVLGFGQRRAIEVGYEPFVAADMHTCGVRVGRLDEWQRNRSIVHSHTQKRVDVSPEDRPDLV